MCLWSVKTLHFLIIQQIRFGLSNTLERLHYDVSRYHLKWIFPIIRTNWNLFAEVHWKAGDCSRNFAWLTSEPFMILSLHFILNRNSFFDSIFVTISNPLVFVPSNSDYYYYQIQRMSPLETIEYWIICINFNCLNRFNAYQFLSMYLVTEHRTSQVKKTILLKFWSFLIFLFQLKHLSSEFQVYYYLLINRYRHTSLLAF